jgi:hypothetical protein
MALCDTNLFLSLPLLLPSALTPQPIAGRSFEAVRKRDTPFRRPTQLHTACEYKRRHVFTITFCCRSAPTHTTGGLDGCTLPLQQAATLSLRREALMPGETLREARMGPQRKIADQG